MSSFSRPLKSSIRDVAVSSLCNGDVDSPSSEHVRPVNELSGLHSWLSCGATRVIPAQICIKASKEAECKFSFPDASLSFRRMGVFLTLQLESGHSIMTCPGSIQYRQTLVGPTRLDLSASVREVELDSAGRRCEYLCQQEIRMICSGTKRAIDQVTQTFAGRSVADPTIMANIDPFPPQKRLVGTVPPIRRQVRLLSHFAQYGLVLSLLNWDATSRHYIRI